jgi:hypothetical protein
MVCVDDAVIGAIYELSAVGLRDFMFDSYAVSDGDDSEVSALSDYLIAARSPFRLKYLKLMDVALSFGEECDEMTYSDEMEKMEVFDDLLWKAKFDSDVTDALKGDIISEVVAHISDCDSCRRTYRGWVGNFKQSRIDDLMTDQRNPLVQYAIGRARQQDFDFLYIFQ